MCRLARRIDAKTDLANSLEAVCCWNEPVARAAARGASLVAALKAFIVRRTVVPSVVLQLPYLICPPTSLFPPSTMTMTMARHQLIIYLMFSEASRWSSQQPVVPPALPPRWLRRRA